MSSLQRVAHEAARIPAASKLGFGVMIVGLVVDLLAHLTVGVDHAHGGATGTELSAHLVVFAGMLIVLLGVIVDGVRSNHRAVPAHTQGGTPDALR